MRKLALTILAVLAACGGTEPNDPTSPSAQVEVHGPGPGGVLALVADGSVAPSTSNGSDLGTWSAGTIGNPIPPKTVTFELRNVGTAEVALPGTPHVEVRGADAARFPVTDLGVAALPGGAASTFTVGFDGLGAMGPHVAEVAVHLDGRDYVFAVRGETVPTGQH